MRYWESLETARGGGGVDTKAPAKAGRIWKMKNDPSPSTAQVIWRSRYNLPSTGYAASGNIVQAEADARRA